MKTRTLIKNDVVNGKKVELGKDTNHPVFENKQDCKDALDAGTLTVGDCNSGMSVRRQRELAGGQTKNDKLAKTFGYESWDALTDELGLDHNATIADVIELAKMSKSVADELQQAAVDDLDVQDKNGVL